jgi:hypothetical protein
MDYPREPDVQFPEMEELSWMTESDMVRIVNKIIRPDGTSERNGLSTTFDVTKDVEGVRVSVSMTVEPRIVLVQGNIQQGLRDLFNDDDWLIINALRSNDRHQSRVFLGNFRGQLLVRWGGGYKPHFMWKVRARYILAEFLWTIFQVDI